MLKPIAFAVMVFGFCDYSFAQSNADFEKCLHDANNNEHDLTIASCTRVLQAGKIQGSDLATVLELRASAFLGKKFYARAIQDLDEAIRVDPAYAVAFVGRGDAYFNTGE